MIGLKTSRNLNAEIREKGIEYFGLWSLHKMIIHPNDFFAQLPKDGRCQSALMVYIPVCIIYSVLTSLYGVSDKLHLFFIHMANSVLMPVITAILLYCISFALFKGRISFRTLFNITAYSNITLILAWIPGMAWIMGICRIYLIGLGMVKVGGISAPRAMISIFIAGMILLFIYSLFSSFIQ